MRDLLLRFDRWPRRILAGALLLLAAVTAAGGGLPGSAAPAGARRVVVAARDLPAGAVLSAADLRLAGNDAAPRSAFAAPGDLVGRRVAAPVDSGDVLTPARLLGSGLTAGLAPGQLAVAVSVSGAGSGLLVRAGDTVELIAAPAAEGAAPEVLVSSARVLAAVPRPSAGGISADGAGTDLIVATDAAGALQISAAATREVTAAVLHDP